MVALLRLHASSLSLPITLTLAPGAAVLVGRRPQLAALEGLALPVHASQIALVPVACPLTSESHLLAWSDGARVHLLDLASTNGSRWRLPPRRRVDASQGEPVDVELGEAVSTPSEAPAPVTWDSAESFRASLAASVSDWLARAGVAAAVRVAPVDGDSRDRTRVPLGDGYCLAVDDARGGAGRRTEFPAMARALDGVWSFVRAQRGEFEAERDCRHDDLILESPAMQAVHRRIYKAARAGLGGILQGASGVGKSALARCFHDHSERRQEPFVEVNLAEDSDDRSLFVARLFGARAGAATGVSRDRVGLVQAAHRGTLFLDEIGCLPLDAQGVLLRFLDTGTYRRFGDAGDAPPGRADVRVVAGTNVDLREAVRAGAFREDLWWRLSGVVLELPPLRDRREDVAAYLRTCRVDLGAGPRPLLELLSPDARAMLDAHPWDGNFRELRGFVARVPLYASGPTVTREVCAEALRAGSLSRPAAAPSAPPPPPHAPAAWDDVMPRAQRLLPLWLAAREEHGFARRAHEPSFDFKVFVEEVIKPLSLARTLGVEHWDALPRRPDPSYQRLAERVGYSDGKSVQELLRIYLLLKRLGA
ncbi:MAG: sigma 54-interacting transcriptional regulator [Polyangiales bacterium]